MGKAGPFPRRRRRPEVFSASLRWVPRARGRARGRRHFPPLGLAAAAGGRAGGKTCGPARRTPGPVGCPGRRGQAGVPGAGGAPGPRSAGGRGRGAAWPPACPSPLCFPPSSSATGRGRGSFFTFLTSPLPLPLQSNLRRAEVPPPGPRRLAGARLPLWRDWLRAAPWPVTSLPPSGLWAGETLALGVGMKEGRKCGRGEGGTGREGAGGEGRPSQRWLPAPALRPANCGPAGLQQLLGLEVRRGGPSLARGRGAGSGRKLNPRAWGRRFAARWHRKRVWPFDWEAANSRDRGPLGRLADQLVGAL